VHMCNSTDSNQNVLPQGEVPPGSHVQALHMEKLQAKTTACHCQSTMRRQHQHTAEQVPHCCCEWACPAFIPPPPFSQAASPTRLQSRGRGCCMPTDTCVTDQPNKHSLDPDTPQSSPDT
jgi:hypothetical protein